MDSAIKLKNISFSYPGGRRVFEGLDFEYEINSRIGISGGNGCGKSTLFKIITGLVKARCGQVELFGRRMQKEKDFAPLRTKIGFLFQNPQDQLLCPDVSEDIAFGPLNKGKSISEAGEAVEEALETFKLEKYKKRNPFKLSGGEKHLIALAGISAMKPEILLLDEPFQWLDGEYRDIVLNYLKEVPSFILISQDKSLLKQLCPEGVYKLHQGNLENF